MSASSKLSFFSHLKKLWAFPFVFCCIFLICARKYVEEYFNTMTGAEFLFFLNTPSEGADEKLVHIFYNKCVLNPIIYALLLCYVPEIFRLLKFIWQKRLSVFDFILRIIRKIPKYYTLLLVIASLIFSGYLLTKFKFLKEVVAMQTAPFSTFFEDHFQNPQPQDIVLKQKKNLVIIAVESMEKTFEDKNFFKQPLIPHLERLEKEGIQFSYYTNGWNTTNTMGHVIALWAGIPKSCYYKKLLHRHGDKIKYLTGYYTLGDFLNDNGYQTYFIQGSNGKYDGQNVFFKDHGIQNFIDMDVMKNKYNVTAAREHWGYIDDVVFDVAKRTLEERESTEPYFMFIQTIDSHANYRPRVKNHGIFNNRYFNIIYNTNLQVYDFVSWLKTRPDYKDTVVVIMGDHLRMANNFPMPEKRRIYNLFLNAPTPPTTKRIFSQVDLFPTVLEAIGAEVKDHHLGLGVSVFSDKPTLLEQYGKSLNGKLSERSKLNEKLWKL